MILPQNTSQEWCPNPEDYTGKMYLNWNFVRNHFCFIKVGFCSLKVFVLICWMLRTDGDTGSKELV
jgi:hypothetical protein